ncbi:TlpA family protein disulfide reductase [Candidatus Magnetomonas plexicatena]|uniref:TlpA family protein disulfide reductase n=1 Tax=Candidatus Magnetomonas plexicatena TaxID=2552947 RepID=UPI001C7694B7|nr:TlpA family protein disulfide reductase [Nitrospirales bacterium LBB_01]
MIGKNKIKALYVMLVFMLSLTAVAYSSEGVREGEPPPTFKMIDENGKEFDIKKLMDRPAIMYFTHNSCHYCTQVVAFLKRAQSKYGKDKISIMGINIMARDAALVKAYKRDLGFTFPMFAGNRPDVLTAYRINYVPVIVFIDSKGLVYKVVGHYIHEKVLDQYIEDIMKK